MKEISDLEVKIFHNSKCSKSRQTFALLEERGIKPIVIEYLKTPPDEETIRHLLKLLNLSPRQLMRTNESEYKEKSLNDESLTEAQLIQAMIEIPKLIERPIVVVDDKKAVIGRPPENVLAII